MALKRITLRDFVIVQVLELDLKTGFTALTGETGAGKSILIDALQLVLGSRGDAGLIREGTSRTDICAEFDCPANARPWLEYSGIEADSVLLMRRTMDVQGKSRAWINGTPVTVTQLRALGDMLVDIHGQHAWQSLTRPESVRNLVDAYGGISTRHLATLWAQWRADEKRLRQAEAAQTTIESERERLQWQIAEVSKLAPAENEWEELEAQHSKLSNAQALLDAAQGALTGMEDEKSGIRACLSRAISLLENQVAFEPEFRTLTDILASSLAQATDVMHSLQAYLRHTELDPDRLAELNTRITQWMALSRRYKRIPGDLPSLLRAWHVELQRLETAADIESLQTSEANSATAYQLAAHQISGARTNAAHQLSSSVTQAMQDLGMAGGLFQVVLSPSPTPGAHGLDDVFFLVASHQGMTPRPIGKVASGGELSRISLAISVSTSELGTASTLIFDEVDSGIGGAVAETVGKLMHQLGCDRQVLAVTHLPQVAASADHHLLVSKQRCATATTSTVIPLSDDQRITELARMLGGERSTATTLAHAREMLHLAAGLQKG
ncbi:MAG: DNA repair protein RecN [Burkholderiaceae bacterium]|nr:DNA repair protein RecN [Burkholderiaceae bacterium]